MLTSFSVCLSLVCAPEPRLKRLFWRSFDWAHRVGNGSFFKYRVPVSREMLDARLFRSALHLLYIRSQESESLRAITLHFLAENENVPFNFSSEPR